MHWRQLGPVARFPSIVGLAVLGGALCGASTAPGNSLTPPKAEKRPFEVRAPAGTRTDEYYWLRDDTRKDPKVLAYLEAENAHADALLAPTRALEDKLYGEMVGRLKQDDATVPYRLRGYWYYTRFETGKDYPIHARRKGDMNAPEEVLLDVNALAAGKGYFAIGGMVVSQDNRLLAWTEDTVGRGQHVLRVKDLATGKTFADGVQNIEETLLWSNDGRTLLYIDKDPVTLLSKRVKAHVLGTPSSDDRLIYEEPDNSFYISLYRTRSDEQLCIHLESTVATEERCTSAARPGELTVLMPRTRDHLYYSDHLNGRWVIRTNWDAPNYRLMTVTEGKASAGRSSWTDLVPHSPEVFIEEFTLFDDFMAISERSGGLMRMRVLYPEGRSELVAADEPAYTMAFAKNAEPDTDKLRYTYTSLATPLTTFELDVTTKQRQQLKQTPVLGYDPKQYVTERLWAPARDGEKVPVSLVYKRGFKRDGTAALFQVGYGSYGSSYDPEFSSPVVSLLDRGVVYAIAHIRGGQELGRAWYEAGRLLNKKNTFTDFIDVTRFLVAQKYAAKDRVAGFGRSAGGLLMGAIANMAPEDYRVIVTQVPFVDAVTTMLDETIPLTTNEFDEWGNPKDRRFYDYMLSYSPYDNLARKPYPAIFVSTSLWDSQVQYYEPAKWVARLRDRKTDDRPLVFRTDMEASHGGKSGRFPRFRQTAEYYAFMLDQLGVR